MRRMDRYREQDSVRTSRTDKNQELYRNVSNNTVYTNITDVVNANAFEINNQVEPTTHATREAYQQMRKYQNIEPVPRTKKELDDFNQVYAKKENKVYDINSVLEEARKNRVEKDTLDDRRKLKNNDYNILTGENREELEKYREEKKKRIMTSEEEMRELIDTIASKTLAGEIDKATGVDLLSDLMATNMMDKVEPQQYIEKDTVEIPGVDTEEEQVQEEVEDNTEDKVIEKKEEEKTEEVVEENSSNEEEKTEIDKEKEEIENELEKKDPEFYTRSMDLSEKDFDLSEEFKEKSLPFIVKFFLVILFLVLIGLTGYFLYKRFM